MHAVREYLTWPAWTRVSLHSSSICLASHVTMPKDGTKPVWKTEVLRPSLPFLQLSLFLLTTMKVRKILHVSSNESTRKVKLTQHQHWLMASSPQRSSVMESRSVGPGWLYMLPPIFPKVWCMQRISHHNHVDLDLVLRVFPILAWVLAGNSSHTVLNDLSNWTW